MCGCVRARARARSHALPPPSLSLLAQSGVAAVDAEASYAVRRAGVEEANGAYVCVCVCACACVCVRACALAHPPTGVPRPTCADTASARQFAHLPLLLNPDKTKLSKRQGHVSVNEFQVGAARAGDVI